MSTIAQDELLKSAFARGMAMISFGGSDAAMVASPAGDADIVVIVVANAGIGPGREAAQEIIQAVAEIMDRWDQRAKDAAA